LTVHGRRLLIDRIVGDGRPIAHVAKELGLSRQCAHRWVRRYREHGSIGLLDRSSRPHHCPRRTPTDVEAAVVDLRRTSRRGQQWIGDELGVPARTVSAILRRYQMPYLRECDPLTGVLIRSSKTTAVRYERERPGELIHMDVKKIGRIRDGGGWKAHGRQMGKTRARKDAPVGFDYVHSVVDDRSRLAYSEILTDEKGATCAAFLSRAAVYFAGTASPISKRS
jgi:transposase